MRAAVVGIEPQEPPVRVMDVPSSHARGDWVVVRLDAPASTASTP
jgi:hypothetical protein